MKFFKALLRGLTASLVSVAALASFATPSAVASVDSGASLLGQNSNGSPEPIELAISDGAVPETLDIADGVREAVNQNTENAAPVEGEGKILQDGTLITKEDLDVSVNVNNGVDGLSEDAVDVIEREDGVQLVATLQAGNADEIEYHLEGKELLSAESGHILVFDKAGDIPSHIIDPAWAQDSEGNAIDTEYRIEGDTLVQVVDMPEGETDIEVYADPYYRNSVVWGNYPTADLVFTRAETGTIAAGFGACSGVIAYTPVRVGCALLGGAAGIAIANNQCVGERKVFLPGTNPAFVNHTSTLEIARWPMTFPC